MLGIDWSEAAAWNLAYIADVLHLEILCDDETPCHPWKVIAFMSYLTVLAAVFGHVQAWLAGGSFKVLFVLSLHYYLIFT